MPATLGQWVSQALEASGKSQAKLAEDMGAKLQAPMDRSKVNKIVLDKRKMSAEEMLAISEITGAALPNELSPASVSIAGKVGAGAQVPVFDAYEKGDGPQVECPPGLNPHGVVAVEVEGDSMEPAFAAGDILFYTRDGDNELPPEIRTLT
jgi:phage repressor protein C with HTH and peptisase S24 domain